MYELAARHFVGCNSVRLVLMLCPFAFTARAIVFATHII